MIGSLSLKAALLAMSCMSLAAPNGASSPDTFSLWVYANYANGSAAIGGLPLFYADGEAYAGTTAPSNASVVSNIYFTKSTTDQTEFLIHHNSTSNATEIDGAVLAINSVEPAYESVKFLSNDTATSTPNTTGLTYNNFHIFGSTVIWKNTTSLEMKSLFYATAVSGQDDLYLLKWNSGGVEDNSAFAAALKTTEPSTETTTESLTETSTEASSE